MVTRRTVNTCLLGVLVLVLLIISVLQPRFGFSLLAWEGTRVTVHGPYIGLEHSGRITPALQAPPQALSPVGPLAVAYFNGHRTSFCLLRTGQTFFGVEYFICNWALVCGMSLGMYCSVRLWKLLRAQSRCPRACAQCGYDKGDLVVCPECGDKATGMTAAPESSRSYTE
jgi:hypothetical protein